jgi:hypothetical protein
MTKTTSVTLVLATAILLGLFCSQSGPVKADDPPAAGATKISVGLYIISFGNYDANKGTYTMDFYIWFRWNASAAPAGFTVEKFEFMNGRAGSKDRISDDYNNSTGTREIWYRVQASLYSDPQFKQYPFDQQTLTIEFEDANLSASKLVYEPLKDESGLDPEVKVAGWHLDSTDFSVSEKSYKWGEQYSRATFELKISRGPTSTSIKTLLPPIVFCIVSGLSFFFPAGKIAQRIGLGTSMLISAVMFHISQTSALPPLGSLIMMDKIMIATYAFLAASLICSALISINEDFWKKPAYNNYVNRYGGMVSVILPFLLFGALWAV